MPDTFDALVAALREAAQQARRQLNEDIAVGGTVERRVTVKIDDGSPVEGYSEIEYYHEGTLTEFDDGATEREVDEILSLVGKLEQMRDSGELIETLPMLRKLAASPVIDIAAAITPALTPDSEPPKVRLPWPGYGGGVVTKTEAAKDYPRDYEPPEGYDWTGEFRVPNGHEPWVTVEGGVENSYSNMGTLDGKRLILRKLADGEEPSYVHPEAAAAAAPAGATATHGSSFEPPSEPPPV